MIKKKCLNCNRYSYCAVDEGVWICPTCGGDLSKVAVEPLDITDRIGKGEMGSGQPMGHELGSIRNGTDVL